MREGEEWSRERGGEGNDYSFSCCIEMPFGGGGRGGGGLYLYTCRDVCVS